MHFIIGVLSSLTATTVIYLLRYQLGFLVNFLFTKVYPDVTGEYRIYEFEQAGSDWTDYAVEDDEVEEEEEQDTENEVLSDTLSGKVSDRELLEWLKKHEQNNPEIIKLRLKQFANRVKGDVILSTNGKITELEKVQGRITPSRILILNSETKDEHHHNFGTYLLTIKNDARIMKGTKSGLCISCGDAFSSPMILEKD